MDQELQKKMEEQDGKLDAIYASVEKMRKYMLVTMWVTVAVVVLPVAGLLFIVPMVISSYTSSFEGLL